MKRRVSYGINAKASLMYPCSEEVSQVVCCTHEIGVVAYGFKYKAGSKSKKPWSENVSQALSSECHDASVCLSKIKRS